MRKTILLVLAALCLQVGARAHAQGRSTNVDLFEPALGPRNFLTVHGADTLGHLQFGLGLWLDFQHNPATLSDVSTASGGGLSLGNQRTSLVTRAFLAQIQGALGLADIAQVGLTVPVILNIDSPASQVAANGQLGGGFSTAALGDLLVEGKIRLLRHRSGVGLALVPAVSIPTGDDDAYSGESNVTGRIRAALSLHRTRFAAAANVGALFRERVVVARGDNGAEIDLSHQLLYGAALSYQFWGMGRPSATFLVELFGRHGFNSYLDSAPMEVDGALRFALVRALAITAGAGAGLVRGIGSPDVRAFAGITWMPDYHDRDRDGVPDTEDRCPDDPEDRDGFRDDDGCPELDNDGDGIPDAEDRCPNDAEDVDGFQDDDGCPEPDNDRDGIDDLHDACPNAPEDRKGRFPKDGCPVDVVDTDRDGVPDLKDRCPDEAEDKDGFQDDDGCPDPDNDGDGIPDAYDECPQVPEDTDGFEDEDGCPDPDNDHDGVLDRSDKCPDKPETINGIADEDGCPDAGEPHVFIEEKEIRVDAPILMTKGKKLREAISLLDQVALMLGAHPELTKVRLEIHRQPKESDQTASQRAAAMKQHLVGRGVAVERLTAEVPPTSGPPAVFVIEERVKAKSPKQK